MSLVGFQARNHPQQVAKGGAKLHVDDMATPPELFDALSERFGGFTLDVAASAHNAKCERFLSAGDSFNDGLGSSWDGERVWCNPPYSDIRPWVEKAWTQWLPPEPADPAELIVMLLPANRTEQRWWQESVEPYRDGKAWERDVTVEFLPGRPRFIRYEDGIVRPNERPPFGCCLLIWGQRAYLEQEPR